MFRSITTVKADLAQAAYGITGKGIVWAVISSGVDGTHPHFKPLGNLKLPKGLKHIDFSTLGAKRAAARRERKLLMPEEDNNYLGLGRLTAKPVDPKGHGTSVAGIIAGQSVTKNGSSMKGLAPETTILSISVLNELVIDSEFAVLFALRALQQINEQGLRVHGITVPLSFQWDVRNYACGHSPICVEVDRLVNSGVIVVTVAGNRGTIDDSGRSVEAGITDPGNAEQAITVGATHRTLPQVYGASFFSSRGATSDGRHKPDLLAPGERLEVCGRWSNGGYFDMDGTHLAAAYVSGAAAAILSAQPDLIGKPQEVKSILLRTATDLGREKNYQGAGLLDVLAAVREATGSVKRAGSVKNPVKVFCSYADNDKSLWAELKPHLSLLERTGQIEVWSNELIVAGQNRIDEIQMQLNQADVILLLLSTNYIASDSCYMEELPRALELQAQGGTKIIPIVAAPVMLTGTPLENIKVLPTGAKSITAFKDPNEGWEQVAGQLHDIVTKLGK